MPDFTGASLEAMRYDLSTWKPNPDLPPVDLEGEEREQWVKDARESLERGAWEGIIPEPSADALTAFLFTMQDARLKVAQFESEQFEAEQQARRDKWTEQHPDKELPDDETIYADLGVAELRSNIAGLMSRRQGVMHEQRAALEAALATFTQNTPGRDVLRYLPHRPFEVFLGWVTGHFSPEGVRAASQL